MNVGHWQEVYGSRGETQTSWFRPHLDRSLAFIEGLGLALDTPIVDVGGGRSTLVDDLLARGYLDLTVLDLSAEALAQSRARLDGRAQGVQWLTGDVLELDLPAGHYGLWHDRAVFHFLTEARAQDRYAECARRSLRAGGFLLVATFAEDGPERCSGLPVCRYGADALAERFGAGFERMADGREEHRTPADALQVFTYLVLRRSDDAAGPNARTTPAGAMP